MKSLVIVESPAKAKTINKILGKDFVVRASMGHVRDLPEKELGVDIEKDFKPKYVAIKSREKVLKELKDIAAKSEAIYLAPDPDREGEAIAWHLMQALRVKNDKRTYHRVTYNEITAPAIRKAFAEPRTIDQNKVDSQQARRVLDRIVGYQVSPLLWRRIRGASSAGRVQSVALRLVCEREREILGFKPEEYWILGAVVRKLVDPLDPFVVQLARINNEKAEVKSADQAHAIRADLEGRSMRVAAIIPRELTRRAPPAYITSTLQQAGSRFFGFTPKRTMQLAQKLYEGEDFGEGPVGLITYMRTDSVAISPVAQQAAREFIHRTYGPDYIPETPNFYKSKSGAQEAHEAIRPTDVNRTPDSLQGVLEPDELKVYRIIWQRFVACQMAPARIAQRSIEVEAPPPAGKTSTYLFRASTSSVTFPGYMKALGFEAEKKEKEDEPRKEGEEEETPIPPLETGESLERMEWKEERKETQPPPRYTEATLIKALEENGVGRPSTYAQTVSVIIDREYVDKDKRALKPTARGFAVSDFLIQHLPDLFEIKFTANMEELLDEVEEGKVEWHQMLADFYKSFSGWVEKAKAQAADPKVVAGLLDQLETVKEWAPPTTRGKKTYSDDTFLASVREQMQAGEKPISERQLVALFKMAVRYKDQLPNLEQAAKKLGVADELLMHTTAHVPPSEEMQKKVELLTGANFAPPRQVGKKVYDDRVFWESLRGQVQSGKGLSVNQMRYVDRMLHKYSDQIPRFAEHAAALGIVQEAPADPHAGDVLQLMGQVKTWQAPTQRGKRVWDDKAFYESLSSQFVEKKTLSFRQAMALKKMARRYADQIPNYDQMLEPLRLLPRRKPKKDEAKKEEAE